MIIAVVILVVKQSNTEYDTGQAVKALFERSNTLTVVTVVSTGSIGVPLLDPVHCRLDQRLFVLRTRDRKLRTVIIYDVYIIYWAFDEHLKPCCCNGCSCSQTKKSICTTLLCIIEKRFTHVSTFLCAM